MASRRRKEKKDFLDKITDILTNLNKLRKPHRLATAGVVAAIVGGLIKSTVFTRTFPEPWDILGNAILFSAMIMIVFDFLRGGLLD
jgi:hypothetical protein